MIKNLPNLPDEETKRLRQIAGELLSQNGLSGAGLVLLWLFYQDFAEFKTQQAAQQEQIRHCQQAVQVNQNQLWELIREKK